MQYSNHTSSKSAPLKPAKHELNENDELSENDKLKKEDLERVLKLSLKESERDRSVKKAYLNDKSLAKAKDGSAKPEAAKPDKKQTIATVSKVRALYDLISYEPDELSFRKGDIITVIELVYRDWWRGSLANGTIGMFPLNHVTPIVDKSPEEVK